MSSVLVDSSVWIEYFRNKNSSVSKSVDLLMDADAICTNDLILSELIPILILQKQTKIIESLNSIPKFPLNIDWKEIIEMQVLNLKQSIQKVGIPDLLIAQNAIQHHATLFTLDKQFQKMSKHAKLKLFEG